MSSPAVMEVSPKLQRLIDDVRSHQIPALLSPNDAVSSMEEGERELLSSLKRIEVELQDFVFDCADAGGDASERSDWSKVMQQAQSQVAAVVKESQSALVRARREYKAQARNALWSDMAQSREEREKRQGSRLADQSSEDKLMTASGDVTSALQRAVTLMSIELEKSSYSSQLLDESSMSIQQATLEYTSFTNVVSSSRKLIKSMERADFLDAIMLCLSFLFFVVCIAYIVKVRIWDRGIGILSFLLRLGGLGTSRSAEEVQWKLKAAQEAAKQTARQVEAASKETAAQLAKTAATSIASVTTAALSAATQAVQSPIAESVHDEL